MAYKAKGEGLVLELMRHPDTTPEQLADCRRVTLSIDGLLKQAVTGLRRVYPLRKANLMQHPWWAAEFNRYEEQKELTIVTPWSSAMTRNGTSC